MAGPAIGQFEIKNLDAEPGAVEFQSQNAYSFGQPSRAMARGEGGEIVYDDNSVTRQRHALEMELGYTRYFKTRVGIEFEKERFDDPPSISAANGFDDITLSEMGAEGILVVRRREGDGWGLGLVSEIEYPLENGEDLSLFLGTILELAHGPWSMTLQPMAVHFFGGTPEAGERTDDKWDFAYAAKVQHDFSETWALALEAYGTVERLGSTGVRGDAALLFGDHNQHRAGPVLYYARRLDAPPAVRDEEDEGTLLTVGLGFLAGLNDNTPDGTLKLSIELDY